MALTKDHISHSLQSGIGLSRSESSRHLESALNLIKHSLADGDDALEMLGQDLHPAMYLK